MRVERTRGFSLDDCGPGREPLLQGVAEERRARRGATLNRDTYTVQLITREIADVVSYLSSLRGEPAP